MAGTRTWWRQKTVIPRPRRSCRKYSSTIAVRHAVDVILLLTRYVPGIIWLMHCCPVDGVKPLLHEQFVCFTEMPAPEKTIGCTEG